MYGDRDPSTHQSGAGKTRFEFFPLQGNGGGGLTSSQPGGLCGLRPHTQAPSARHSGLRHAEGRPIHPSDRHSEQRRARAHGGPLCLQRLPEALCVSFLVQPHPLPISGCLALRGRRHGEGLNTARRVQKAYLGELFQAGQCGPPEAPAPWAPAAGRVHRPSQRPGGAQSSGPWALRV